MTRLIFNENDNLSWRLRALDIVLKSEISDLSYFLDKSQEFINNRDGSYQIKQKLILNFKTELDYFDYLDELKFELLNDNLDQLKAKDSLSFLFLLDEFDFDLVFEILNKSSNISLLKNIILKINSNDYYLLLDNDYRLKYLKLLEEIFFKFDDYDLRSLIIFSLTDFLSEDFENDYLILLQRLYVHESCDRFSKFLIADILNSHSDKNYAYPEIDQAEWADYYNFSN